MTKKQCLFFLVFSCLPAALRSLDTQKIVEHTFGPTGTELSLVSYHFVEDLFSELAHTTPYEQMRACTHAATSLTQEIEHKEAQLATAPPDAQSYIDYFLSVLTVQRDHFERVARLIKQEMPQTQQYLGWIKNAWYRTIAFFISPFKSYRTPIQTLAHDLVKYTEIERDEILTNHKKTLLLLVGHNRYDIPLIIRFWDYPRYRHRLLNGVKQLQGNAYPQAGIFAAAGEVLADAAAAASEALADAAAAGGEAVGAATVAVVSAAGKAATEALAEAGEALGEALANATAAAAKGLAETVGDASANVLAQTAGAAGRALAATTESLTTESTATAALAAAQETVTATAQGAARTTQESLQTLGVAQGGAGAEGDLAAQGAAEDAGNSAAVEEGQSITQTGDQALQTTPKSGEKAAEEAPKTLGARFKAWAKKTFTLKEFGKMALMLILQSEVSMGAQLVASWQSAQDALTFASLSQQRTTLMTNLNHYFSALATQQSNTMARIDADFSSKIGLIAEQLCLQPTSDGTVVIRGLMPSLFTLEQAFITQALTSATVKQVFFINALQEDQLFYLSPMVVQQVIRSYDPFLSNGLKNSWYNPYRSGNWQFCSTDYSGTTQGPVTSFVQYTNQPFANQNYPNGDPTIAVQNSIFTDYIPPIERTKSGIESYTISIECTLLAKPSTPFMMGVMFNGARWIPGILDLHHQHRLLCIYSLPHQKPGTYNVGFAETFYQSATNAAQDQLADKNIAGLNAIWPAYQILNPTIDILAQEGGTTAVPNPIATIPALPVGTPYILTIQNEANNVTLTISTKDGTVLFPTGQPSSPSANTPGTSGINHIQNLNRVFFIYHNIGFTAPGCSAQFTILQPQALRLSDAQQQAVRALTTSGGSSS